MQIEVDEAAFGLEDAGEGEPGTAVVFNEYVGAMPRGQPSKLVLTKRDPAHCAATRAVSGRACPPAIYKSGMEPIQERAHVFQARRAPRTQCPCAHWQQVLQTSGRRTKSVA